MSDPIKDLERLVEANNRIASIDATKEVEAHWDAYHEQECAYIELDHEALLAHVNAMEKVCDEVRSWQRAKAFRHQVTHCESPPDDDAIDRATSDVCWHEVQLINALSLLDGKGAG